MSATPTNQPSSGAPAKAPGEGPMVFGSADLRLNGKQWGIALAILVPLILLTPWLWSHVERFETGPDYRQPYALSRDYWLYQRRIAREIAPTNILMIGDSVIWGEYVRPDGTLATFLNREAGDKSGHHFVNVGVNGMFPLALEGLVRHYAPLPRGQKVMLNCNLLWMTSPKVDLSSDKQEHFNHSRLVPQFSPRIPSYRADASERLGAVIEQHVPLLGWVNHLQDAYFDQKSISTWTLEDDGKDPPHYPNAWKNPFSQLTMVVPSAPANDPDRGPESPRHHPWSDKPRGNSHFDWVSLDKSLQWAAFRRLVEYLQSQGADVFVMVGPFNEHMLAEDNVPACHALRDGIDAWLTQHQVSHFTPEALPSQLYADASHPLTSGYELLAKRMREDAIFAKWMNN